MRIVAGRLRGRPLVAPRGAGTRPTADRARETLFNMLAHGGFTPPGRPPAPQGMRVLDLFAGSGALGLEALSRGAMRAVFVERDTAARAALRQNIEALDLTGATQVLRRDATDLGPLPAPVGGRFDLVLLDPPYRHDLAAPALISALAGGWLTQDAVAVAEIAADEPAPEPDGFELLETRRSGEAQLAFYRVLSATD
jgi:16S rRNA (guanine966-N2)-methyltransferase